VLAVDDDGLVLANTAAMLGDLGHEALEAGSGPEALEILRAGATVDLVITDQAMPGMTGVQLAAAIRAERPGLPVLLVTGYAEFPPDALADLPRLAKPFRRDALAQVLAELVREPPPGERVLPFRPRRG
jgi:CheY-like chemotaxis protein